MTWHVAVSTGCCINMPVTTTLQAFHDAGVHAVELATQPRHFDPWRHDEVVVLAHRLRELRMTPVAMHAPFGGLLDLTDPNPHHRHATIGAILSAVSALREFGGTRVVVHASDAPRRVDDVDARVSRGAESLKVLARACTHMDAQLLVETPMPHLVGGHPDEFAAMLRPLDHAVGVCLDTSHATLAHHWDALLRVAGPRLAHVHLSDHHGHTDDHLPPGDGVIDWTMIRASLVDVGFAGWLVLELSCPSGPLAECVSTALRRTHQLFDPEGHGPSLARPASGQPSPPQRGPV